MPARDPRILAYFMIAGGLGLAGWYGLELYEMPERTPAQVNEMVELRLALELQHMGPLLQPDATKLGKLQALIRSEVEAHDRLERQAPERWLGIGLVLMVFGASSYILSLARRPMA
jgi:hypothetical protein